MSMKQNINEMVANEKTFQIGRWKYIGLGIIIMMLLGTVYSYSVFRVALERYFNIGTAQSGMPYMISLAFYALFMLITGKLMQRFHPRVLLLAGGFLVSLGWILSSFAPSIFLLTLTFGCIIGAGVGIAYGVPMAVVAKWFPDKRGLAVGMVIIGFGLSPLITAPLVSSLINSYGVMSTFLFLGLAYGLLLPLLVYSFRYPTELELANVNRTQFAPINANNFLKEEMVRSKRFRGLYINFLIGSLIGLMLVGLTANIGVYLIGLDRRIVAFLISIFAIFNGVGRPTLGWLIDKLTIKRVMVLSFSLIILAAIMSIVSIGASVLSFMISFSIFWFNLGGWLAIAPASTIKLFGIENYSQNYGLVFTAYGIGALIGVTISGVIVDVSANYQNVFYLTIFLCLIGLLVSATHFSGDN